MTKLKVGQLFKLKQNAWPVVDGIENQTTIFTLERIDFSGDYWFKASESNIEYNDLCVRAEDVIATKDPIQNVFDRLRQQVKDEL